MITLPEVKKILVASRASLDVTSQWWTVEDIWTRRFVPAGNKFPFRQDELYVYIQLSGGRGALPVGIGVDRLKYADDGGVVPHYIGVRFERSPISLPRGGNPLAIVQTALLLRRVPFRREAEYRFRVVARLEGGLVDLPGEVAIVPILATEWS